MIKTNGSVGRYKPLEKKSITDNIYIIRWDYAMLKNIDVETKEELPSTLATWAEEIIYHKPTLTEIKKLIESYYNKITDNKILQGFIWNEMMVWLSEENQRNYKAIYDIAVQENGANLPTTFKFGTEDAPTYYVFNTVEELKGFYLSALAYIQQCYTEGWKIKDTVDYSAYDID